MIKHPVLAMLLLLSQAVHASECSRTITKQSLGVFLRDGTTVVGGVYGTLEGALLKIAVLWIHPKFRKGGDGKRLVSSLEQGAYALGARRSSLTTASFQAPGFYTRLGYSTKHVDMDCPIVGTSTHLMRKTLVHAPEAASFPIEQSPSEADIAAIANGLNAHNDGLVDIRKEILPGVGVIYGDWLFLGSMNTPSPEALDRVIGEAASRGVRVIAAEIKEGEALEFLKRHGFVTSFEEDVEGTKKGHVVRHL